MDILRLNMHFTMVKVQAFFVHYLSVKCLCRSNQGLYFYGAQPCCCAFLFVREMGAPWKGKQNELLPTLWKTSLGRKHLLSELRKIDRFRGRNNT